MPRRLSFRTRGCAALVAFTIPMLAAAQDAPAGFRPSSAAAQRRWEATLRGVPDTAQLQRHMRWLSARTHVAGTPRQRETADYVLREMAAMGLDTVRYVYDVWLPHPDSAVVELVGPTRRRLRLGEPALAADPTSREPRWPTVNGYSGRGDATAPVVYVNYGLIEDYAELARTGVDVRGKIVIARYGRSFRGIKAREAEQRGAVALVLYSDPADDGYVTGDVYPEGPMRHPDAPQRGSVYNGQGDPSTPGWPSLPGARRLAPDSMRVPRIPVVPVGYAQARVLLEPLRGAALPAQSWQGGLPFRYHVGGSPEVRARVAVFMEPERRWIKRIENTVGILRGATHPDEWVITGGHRDAWGPGAIDNVTGTSVILESARAFATAARQGQRPARTVMFATWDAEEWGIVGSTEWAEHMADSLKAKAVAYLNQDVPVSGRAFGSSATASLHAFVRDAAAAVPHPTPGDSGSVRDVWSARTKGAMPFGDLGGGSDFFGFYNFLGIPSFDFGFGGPGGVYHAHYDTWHFVERFADPGYRAHRSAAQLNATLLARLANADALPFDFAALGRYLALVTDRLRPAAEQAGLPLDTSPIVRAALALAAAGDTLAQRQRTALAAGAPRAAFDASNAIARTVEAALTRTPGLVGRPFARNLVFAADRDNGYANVALPGVAEALRDRDTARVAREVADLASRLDEATARVRRATAALAP
ncbi:MAG: M20/M25/M40 family metallo-hydrolase [Gemmatimonadaceae bacterium]|jgi:N-acetylated-alpha-linked acidic dipeptidase|nr:M20/M25/M40 family metallo-hydrolase [Gemmatimonadaceae bacterium]